MTDRQLVLALIGLSITLLGSLIVTVWRASALVTQLRLALEAVRSSITKIELGLSRLEMIPVHENRIGQLEQLVAHLGEKVETLWRKLFSVDKHVAVLRHQSKPDLQEVTGDSEPPEKP